MRRLFVLPLFALLLSACPRPQYPECNNDDDCKDHGQVCINRICRECRDDSQCAGKPGTICKDNACVAKPQCTADRDCGAGQKCRDQKCVAECSAAADCGPGQACVVGRCVAAPRTEAPPACELRPPHFDFDDASLTREAREVLDQDWQCLQKSGFRRLVIAGHCDERGTTEYNLALGERRAKSVQKYLTGLGADATKLQSISYGKERPADPGHNEAAWAKNRRAELSIEAGQ